MSENQQRAKHLRRLDAAANWLDSKFKIPFTQNARFGLDSFMGFVPYLGDVTGFAVSLLLVRTISKNGVGIGIFFKMLFNILLDAAVGVVPILGDFFDIAHKANRKNVNLLRAYYEKNPNPPSANWSFSLLGLLFLVVMGGLAWLTWQFAGVIWTSLGSMWNMIPK